MIIIDAKYAEILKEKMAKRIKEKKALESIFIKLASIADEVNAFYAKNISQGLLFRAKTVAKSDVKSNVKSITLSQKFCRMNPCTRFLDCSIM